MHFSTHLMQSSWLPPTRQPPSMTFPVRSSATLPRGSALSVCVLVGSRLSSLPQKDSPWSIKFGLVVALTDKTRLHCMIGYTSATYPITRTFSSHHDQFLLSLSLRHRGGALTTFTAFNDLLKPHAKAFLTFTCLLNTGSWGDGLMEGAGKDSLEAYLYG